MSKKSLLYIIIIVCVLTSGFFLASNYRSSIEMKNRGENIVPSVKDVEDIKQPQIEFIKNMETDESCAGDPSGPYSCGDTCCNAENYCYSLGGYYNGTTCYDNQAEYCSTLPATPNFDGSSCVCNSGLFDNGACVTSCASERPYNNGGSCSDTCPVYIDGRTCVDSCNLRDGNKCVSSCPSERKYNNGGVCSDTCPVYIDGTICVDSCTLRDGNSCVSSCPSERPYNNGGVCVNSCTLRDGNTCVSSCPSERPYNNGGVCVDSCTLRDENSCVSSCPSERPYNNGGVCVNSCNLRVGNTCVGECPSSSPYIANGVCYNDSQCRSQFNGQGYPNGTTCHNSQLAYCKTINPSYDIVFENNCYIKNSDSYCLAAKGTHYSGGSCRSNADECVALELKGAEYKGSPDEKYNPTKCDSVADKCYRDGKVLYGGKCITYQQKCEEISKGTWKNGTCVTNNNGGNGVSGKTSNKDKDKDKNDNPKTDDVIGTDASLSDIVLSSGRLMFDFGTSDYRVEVSSNVESITIEPITTDPDATFVVNGDTKLKSGDNVFTIVVTAEDGKTTRTYNLTIVRTDRILSSNSKASLISIANHEINFDKDQTEYEVNLTKDEEELDIKVTAEDNLSITEVLGNEGLENGDIVTVKVTAEDGSYTVYAIKVNKEVPFNIKDYIPYIIAGVAGLLLIIVGAAILKGRKSNDDEDDLDEDNGKDKMKDDKKDDFKMKDNDEDKDDFKMKSKDSK